MSVKIVAFTHPINNYESLIKKNLRLSQKLDPLNSSVITDYLEGYNIQWETGVLPPLESLISVEGYAYFNYFHKNSPLRFQYFDMIRAFGLNEMWLMTEDISELIDDNTTTIDEALCSLKDNYHFEAKEFSEYHYHEDEKGFPTDYGALYHDDFGDCFNRVFSIEKEHDIKVLGLYEVKPDFIRVLKNDEIMYLHLQTKRLSHSTYNIENR